MNGGNITSKDVSDEQLNLFIDEQLEQADMDEIRQLQLDDRALRERVCQLRAVRELVGYAYSDVPRSKMDRRIRTRAPSRGWSSALAASVLLLLGSFVGWMGHSLNDNPAKISTSRQIFDYFSTNIPVNHAKRKIIIHVSSGDLLSLKKALDETEQLQNSYEAAGTPISIDIIANKGGINLLRSGVSPYAARIKKMAAQHSNIQFYACARSIAKAKRKAGRDFAMLPQAHIARPARELIPERIDKGWIYIKV